MSTAVREASSGIIDVKVSDDRLEAYLLFRPGARITPPTSADVSQLLTEQRIPVDREAMVRVKDALSECRKGSIPRGGVLLARGKPPEQSKDEQLIWKIEPELESGETPLPLRRVHKGDVVAELSPPALGQPGLDVHGNPIPAEPPKKLNLTVGQGLRLADDHSLHAETDGVAIQSRRSVRIEPLLEANAADIDVGKGAEAPGVLLIHGDPPAGVFLQAKAGIFVDGKLGATLLTCGGPLVCTQGIEGQKRERTRIDVRGSVMTPHLFDARLNIRGALKVAGEIHGVKAHVVGELKAPEAMFSGGEITVSGNAELGVLGSPGRDDTNLAVGVHHDMRQQYDRLSRIIEQLNRAIGMVEQACFLSNTQHADPTMKERICQWEMARDELGRLRTTVQGQISEIGRSMLEFIDSSVTVNETIHPGCTVTVAGVVGKISAQWAGQVTVTHHMISGKNALIVESKSGRKMVIR